MLKPLLYLKKIYYSAMPTGCLLCGSACHTAVSLCEPCALELPSLPQSCARCARFLQDTSQLCGTCQQTSPPFDRILPLFPYTSPVIEMVKKLKFAGDLRFAKLFSELFLQRLSTWYVEHPLPHRIMPIPLHSTRLRERGFNQALEMAKPLAKRLRIPLDFHSIQRYKPTAVQSCLRAADRPKNMANAFKSTHTYNGMQIAVLDDVVTTGSTVNEFCRLLRQGGALSIDIWCCARSDIAH